MIMKDLQKLLTKAALILTVFWSTIIPSEAAYVDTYVAANLTIRTTAIDTYASAYRQSGSATFTSTVNVWGALNNGNVVCMGSNTRQGGADFSIYQTVGFKCVTHANSSTVIGTGSAVYSPTVINRYY